MGRLALLGTALTAIGLASVAFGAGSVEDWTTQRPGSRGIPVGWRAYETPGGRPAYDFAVKEDDGHRALQVSSRDDHSTIAKEIHVDLGATPILEWSWK